MPGARVAINYRVNFGFLVNENEDRLAQLPLTTACASQSFRMLLNQNNLHGMDYLQVMGGGGIY